MVAVVRPSADAAPSRRAFFLGLLTGAVYFAGTLYWLVETMTTFGGLPAAVASLPRLRWWRTSRFSRRRLRSSLHRLRASMGTPLALLCAAPAWVATELGRQYLWDGFPWALLGYSQVTVLPIAQLASVTGVYGLSGLLALTAAAAAFVVVDTRVRRWGCRGGGRQPDCGMRRVGKCAGWLRASLTALG